MKAYRRLSILFITVMASLSAFAGPVTVKAKLDSAQLLMGNITTLHMEVVQNKNTKGEFAMFRELIPDGIIGVCGDSVELRTSFSRDTLDLGSGRIQINYQIPVQAFDSGMYRLPRFNYIVGRDTVKSNQVTLKVVPVNVAADAEISGYAGVVPPAESNFFDFLPDWVIDYWWVIVAIILLIAAMTYLILRKKKTGHILPPKPQPKPWTVALGELQRLKARNLWEQGMEREYYTELTEILRVYLDKRFGINAMEMTTSQILDCLSADPQIKDKKEYMQRILDVADFVKFAAVKSLPSDNIESFDNAERFVRETIPAETEETKKKKTEDGFEIDADDIKDIDGEAKEEDTKGGRS